MPKWSACCKNIIWVHSLHSRLWQNDMSTVYCVRTKREQKWVLSKRHVCRALNVSTWVRGTNELKKRPFQLANITEKTLNSENRVRWAPTKHKVSLIPMFFRLKKYEFNVLSMFFFRSGEQVSTEWIYPFCFYVPRAKKRHVENVRRKNQKKAT